MSEHLSAERMHDLLDGLLTPDEAGRSEAHLEGCATCRDEYRALRDVVEDLRGLPAEAHAPAGAWQAIEARIAGGGSVPGTGGAEVLSFPGAAAGRRRLTFTVPQLAAAAVLVALVSAGSVWMALNGRPGAVPSSTPLATAPALERDGSAAHMAASGEVAYDAALLELQDLVDENREILAPETREALDRSLQTIDAAIDDIRRALQQDPNSELLARLLINQQRSKLRVLGQAATAIQARS
jgi:hypothetical protein